MTLCVCKRKWRLLFAKLTWKEFLYDQMPSWELGGKRKLDLSFSTYILLY